MVSLKLEEWKNDGRLYDASPSLEVFENEIKIGLEKSKSDSKINENLIKNELTIENGPLSSLGSRERSNSNQMLKKKDKSSPKIDKKGKNKKSKSSSKLYDMKKNKEDSGGEEDEEQRRNGGKEEVLSSLETSALFAARSNNDDNKNLKQIKDDNETSSVKNKYIIECLSVFKQFYEIFACEKILPPTFDVEKFFTTLVQDKQERTNKLEEMLSYRLNPVKCEQLDRNSFMSHFINSTEETLSLMRRTCGGGDRIVSCYCFEYETAMTYASNILLEFSTFPGLVAEDVANYHLPFWLKVLLTCACCADVPSKNIQITAMNTILEVISLAKSQYNEKQVSLKSAMGLGILEMGHVKYIEESTLILEVSLL